MNEDDKLKKIIEEEALKIMKSYLKTSAFTDRKLTDTPSDANQVVPRRFVTANGATADRPPNPVAGQFYYDSSLGVPIWWNGSVWKKADGTSA